MAENYIELQDLNVYKLARMLSIKGWKLYNALEWQIKKIMGYQFISSTDSVGANIAEGYGRFHYLDKVKFYYNARGSLFESKHWIDLLAERKCITIKDREDFLDTFTEIKPSLNGLIGSIKKTKKEF